MMDLRQLSRDILSHRMIKNDLEKEGFLNCMKASLWKEVTRSDHVTTKEEMEDSVKKALTKSGTWYCDGKRNFMCFPLRPTDL